jgi:16S rRNA (cytosine1402-N4)-methyltransferase
MSIETAASCHESVLPREIVKWIGESQPKLVVDGTFGGGGHARLMLEQIPSIERVVGLDRDPSVVARFSSPPSDPRLTVVHASYEQTPDVLKEWGGAAQKVDAMVLDLGLSSDQLADSKRGFSFNQDGPLDLRFDSETGEPAWSLLGNWNEKEIADTIYRLGEERYSRRVAREIVARRRERKGVKTVQELVDICRRCVPRSKNHDIHPATRTFQALRIAVNNELGILERTLQSSADWFSLGGRIAVISFHSLEDRIVKHVLREDPRWQVLTKKPIRPSDEEVRRNPRSRSAKLRVAERLENTPHASNLEL